MIEQVIKSKKYIQNLNKIKNLLLEIDNSIQNNQSRCSQLQNDMADGIAQCNGLIRVGKAYILRAFADSQQSHQVQLHTLHARYDKISSIDSVSAV